MIDKIKYIIENIPRDKILHFSVGILLCINITTIFSIVFNHVNKITVSITAFVITFIILYIDEYFIQARKPNRNAKDYKDLLAGTLGALSITSFVILMILL